jgi:hypothetical protein
MKFMVNSGSDFGAVCNLWSILLEEICGLQAADYRIWEMKTLISEAVKNPIDTVPSLFSPVFACPYFHSHISLH